MTLPWTSRRALKQRIYGAVARSTFRNPAFTAPIARVFFPASMDEEAKREWIAGRFNSFVWHLGGRSASVA